VLRRVYVNYFKRFLFNIFTIIIGISCLHTPLLIKSQGLKKGGLELLFLPMVKAVSQSAIIVFVMAKCMVERILSGTGKFQKT